MTSTISAEEVHAAVEALDAKVRETIATANAERARLVASCSHRDKYGHEWVYPSMRSRGQGWCNGCHKFVTLPLPEPLK